MEFLRSFLRRYFAVKSLVASRNVGCFPRFLTELILLRFMMIGWAGTELLDFFLISLSSFWNLLTAKFSTDTFEKYFCLWYLQWLLRSLKKWKDFIWSTRLIGKFSDSIDRSFTGFQGGDIISTPSNFSIYFLALPFFSFLKEVFFECLYYSWFYLVKLSLLRLKTLTCCITTVVVLCCAPRYPGGYPMGCPVKGWGPWCCGSPGWAGNLPCCAG